MRVRCVTNKISNLPADSIVARQKRHYFGNDDFVHLTPNKTYVVYALVECQHEKWIYIADDDYPSVWYPLGYLLDFFEVVDERVSKLWKTEVEVACGDAMRGNLRAFEEWTADPNYYGRLVDRGRLEVMLFKERKEFMDLEYPYQEEFKCLTHFDSRWCQCPSCEHIWEDGMHELGMKRCPACMEVLVDELWSGK